MENITPKKILIEPISDEEFKLLVGFLEQHKTKSFIVEDSKAETNDIFNDVVRFLIPIA